MIKLKNSDCDLDHGGEKQSFVMKPLRSFNSPLQRQANEGVRITASKATILMNSKNEWHQAPIIRVVAASGLAGDQGEDQSPVLLGAAGRGRGRGGRGGRGDTGGVRSRGSMFGRGRRPPGTS